MAFPSGIRWGCCCEGDPDKVCDDYYYVERDYNNSDNFSRNYTFSGPTDFDGQFSGQANFTGVGYNLDYPTDLPVQAYNTELQFYEIDWGSQYIDTGTYSGESPSFNTYIPAQTYQDWINWDTRPGFSVASTGLNTIKNFFYTSTGSLDTNEGDSIVDALVHTRNSYMGDYARLAVKQKKIPITSIYTSLGKVFYNTHPFYHFQGVGCPCMVSGNTTHTGSFSNGWNDFTPLSSHTTLTAISFGETHGSTIWPPQAADGYIIQKSTTQVYDNEWDVVHIGAGATLTNSAYGYLHTQELMKRAETAGGERLYTDAEACDPDNSQNLVLSSSLDIPICNDGRGLTGTPSHSNEFYLYENPTTSGYDLDKMDDFWPGLYTSAGNSYSPEGSWYAGLGFAYSLANKQPRVIGFKNTGDAGTGNPALFMSHNWQINSITKGNKKFGVVTYALNSDALLTRNLVPSQSAISDISYYTSQPIDIECDPGEVKVSFSHDKWSYSGASTPTSSSLTCSSNSVAVVGDSSILTDDDYVESTYTSEDFSVGDGGLPLFATPLAAIATNESAYFRFGAVENNMNILIEARGATGDVLDSIHEGNFDVTTCDIYPFVKRQQTWHGDLGNGYYQEVEWNGSKSGALPSGFDHFYFQISGGNGATASSQVAGFTENWVGAETRPITHISMNNTNVASIAHSSPNGYPNETDDLTLGASIGTNVVSMSQGMSNLSYYSYTGLIPTMELEGCVLRSGLSSGYYINGGVDPGHPRGTGPIDILGGGGASGQYYQYYDSVVFEGYGTSATGIHTSVWSGFSTLSMDLYKIDYKFPFWDDVTTISTGSLRAIYSYNFNDDSAIQGGTNRALSAGTSSYSDDGDFNFSEKVRLGMTNNPPGANSHGVSENSANPALFGRIVLTFEG